MDTSDIKLKRQISMSVWTCLNYLSASDLLLLLTTDGSQDNSNDEAPENNPAYTTVYVGNLAHEVINTHGES